LCGPLLAPLLRLLADPVEACREACVRLLFSLIGGIPDPGALLPALLPALAKRIGGEPVAEPSEEVRLQALRLLEAQLVPRGGSQLAAHVGDVGAILCRALEDPFHEIKKARPEARLLFLCAEALRCAARRPASQHLFNAVP
jgi:hypothetical protein